jgi:tetratricopeptide (TPR) repeat protein
MSRRFDFRILFWVALPLLVLPLLGITPRPRSLARSLEGVREALEAGLPSRAAAELVRVAEFQPWRTELWELAGGYALQGADLQAALVYLQHAAALKALSPRGYLALGDAYQQAGDLEAALQSWDTVQQSGVQADEIPPRLLAVHRAQGDTQAVIADLQALTSLRPLDIQMRYQLGLYLAAYQPEEALAHLAQVADLEPALKPQAEAVLSSIRAASRADDPAYTLLESGRALASLGEWDLAAKAFQGAVDLRPDYAEAWAYLGEARQHLDPDGSASQASPGLAELNKAVQLDPASLVANTYLALYWQRQGETSRALQVLEEVNQLYPENPALLSELGNALAQTGNLQAAQAAYQGAVGLAPDIPDYWRLLAGFSARYEYQIAAAGLPAARRAVALDPGSPANLDVLGQVLLLLQDFTSAERFFQRAVDADPSYATGHVRLGLVYALRGEMDRALNKWKQVELAAPGSAAADQAQRLIKSYFP